MGRVEVYFTPPFIYCLVQRGALYRPLHDQEGVRYSSFLMKKLTILTVVPYRSDL